MNKRTRIWSVLLTLSLLLTMLPTAALAAETGYLVTLNYDTSLCTVTVTDRNDSDATVENGGYLTPGSNGNASAIFEIENIAEGYRIAKVLLNGVDRTVNFITGAYGGMAQSGISKDVTLSVTLEEVPTLPVLKSIEVYTDATYSEALSTDLTLTEATQIYVKGTYADGGEYPEYTARGHMEYTLDGTNWNWTQWGGGYWYFPLNDTFYTEFNPLTDSYDFRICIEPDDLYCTGEKLYSEVYHVNGGASASGDSGSGGESGSGSESGQHKLAEPVNLNWHRFYDYNSNNGSYVDFKGLISWQIADTAYDQEIRVAVYKDGEDVFQNGWIYRAARGEVYQNDWDFSLSDYGSGTYQFTVQALGDRETTADSDVVTSETWEFTAASTKLATPETAWSSAEPLTATWTSSTEDLAGGYQIRMYYSPNNANATSTADLDVVSRFVYYTALDGNQTTFGYDQEGKDGYYYFQVRAISSDESQARHSAWSELSTAYAYGVDDSCDHSYASVVTAPTCTEQGYTTHTCSRCGDSYVDTYENALGHDWGEWVVDKEATGTEDGSRHRNCSRCDAVETEVISKLPKQAVSWFPAGPITWTYGQVISAQNTAYNDSEGGGALTYSSSDESVATVDADGKATIVGAGTVQITATAAAVPGKYAETSASYTLIINKAPLTVTANDHAITYGQAPVGNGWTASGFKYDDTQSVVTGTAAYTYTYEQYGNVGSHAINVSGLTAKNYDITFAPGILTVSKATDYTITLDNLSQRDDDITAVIASIAPQDATAQINVEYQVDGAWTTSLPTAAGEYQVRASLTDSSNIQTDGAYTNGTLTIQRSIVVDDTDVSVTVDGGKAEITVTDEELADIVNSAEGDVSVNLGGVEGVDELVLPGSLLEALSGSDKADSLTITTEDASISMSGAVLDTVAGAVTGDDTVAVKLTAVEEADLNDDQQAALNSISQDAVIVEVSLVITHADGTETELHQLGGNVEVTVPYVGEVPEGKYIVVCYLSDDGNVTYVRATYNAETQQVTFTTNHFSNYAVFVSGDPAVVVDGGSGSGLYAEGATVTIKADSKSGYTFAGWEIVSGDITLANAKAAETTFTMPAANVELKATYTKNSSGGGSGVSTYTLTFETNGGSKIDNVSKASGAAIDLTGYVPTRTGYDFVGWYSDAKLTSKVTSVKLTKNMTVYAKWTEKGGENPFTDVADDAYYADAVIWAVGKGITGGTTATTFTPNSPCTRAQAVTFLWRAAGSPEPQNSVNPFTDVKADAYYANAVLWAMEQGITKGTSDTTFSPYATCTRAQIVTFLWRSQKSLASDSVNPFTDVAADAYYADAVLWAAENGITGGTTATTFSPSSTCTRAQIVTFLYRFFVK